MEVRIKNHLLTEVVDFLYGMELTVGRESRHRSRLNKIMADKIEELENERLEILKEYCEVDEEGNFKTYEKDGKKYYDINDLDAYSKDLHELDTEEFVIDGGDIQIALKTMRKVLDEYVGDLNGRKSVIYDYLCEAFKVDEDLEEDND